MFQGFSSGEISTDQCSSTATDLSNDDGQDTTVVQAVDTGDREHLAKQLEEAQNQDADTDDVCLTYDNTQSRKASDQRMTTLGDAVYFQGQGADADDVHMTHDDTIRREGSDVEKTALYDASHLRQREKSQTGVSESVSMTYTDDGASGEHVHGSSTVDVMDAALPLQREALVCCSILLTSHCPVLSLIQFLTTRCCFRHPIQKGNNGFTCMEHLFLWPTFLCLPGSHVVFDTFELSEWFLCQQIKLVL